MDRKTLEYMEERTKKARKIVETIEKLNSNINKVERVAYLSFRDSRDNFLFESSTGNLTAELKREYLELAKAEICKLELELDEL